MNIHEEIGAIVLDTLHRLDIVADNHKANHMDVICAAISAMVVYLPQRAEVDKSIAQ